VGAKQRIWDSRTSTGDIGPGTDPIAPKEFLPLSAYPQQITSVFP
jgi:hypothetical protein